MCEFEFETNIEHLDVLVTCLFEGGCISGVNEYGLKNEPDVEDELCISCIQVKQRIKRDIKWVDITEIIKNSPSSQWDDLMDEAREAFEEEREV